MVSNGKILKNLMKSPVKLNTGRFKKILKIFENLTPKTLQNLLFIAFLRKEFWPSVLFYG